MSLAEALLKLLHDFNKLCALIIFCSIFFLGAFPKRLRPKTRREGVAGVSLAGSAKSEKGVTSFLLSPEEKKEEGAWYW